MDDVDFDDNVKERPSLDDQKSTVGKDMEGQGGQGGQGRRARDRAGQNKTKGTLDWNEQNTKFTAGQR